MFKSLKLRPVLFGSALIFAFFFQNCSQPQDATQQEASYDQTLPFAYKAQLDTLAYMSCSDVAEGSYEQRAYFTFRAGAYNNSTGGMTLTPGFFQATQYYDNTSRANLLSQTEFNSNTILNFSIRQAGNYQNLYYVDQVTPQETIDQFLPELDLAQVAGPLGSLGPNQFANYFPSNQSQRLMEASLRFLTYETNAQQTRNELSDGNLILVAGYPETANITDQSLKSPLDVQIQGALTMASPTTSNATQVFGVGYKVGFALPFGNSGGDNRVLATFSGVQEVDLTSGATLASSWDCDANFEFQIIDPQDLASNPNLCWEMVDTYSNATEQAALNAIRRVLRVEDWYVDVTHHCVVPRYGGDVCYGSTLNARTIQYSITSCADTATTVCPHMVSVCIRQ